MPFIVTLEQAQKDYPEYKFLEALPPSEQKAAFHVQDSAGQHYCLKIISPDYRVDRLNREILALQLLNHPNVAKLKEYTFSTKQGQQKQYIVEEYIEGGDLTERLKPNCPWAREITSKFFSELCNGLTAVYKKRIVHRDLKPSNIRVRKNDSPVIIDFGVARHLDLPDITNTSQGAKLGTPLYFAPEQWTGTKHDIDHRTDLFALGVLLYQALVGQHPFLHPKVPLQDAVCNSYDYRTNSVFTSLPVKWKLLMNKLLEKDRVNRPHDAGQVADILRKIGAE